MIHTNTPPPNDESLPNELITLIITTSVESRPYPSRGGPKDAIWYSIQLYLRLRSVSRQWMKIVDAILSKYAQDTAIVPDFPYFLNRDSSCIKTLREPGDSCGLYYSFVYNNGVNITDRLLLKCTSLTELSVANHAVTFRSLQTLTSLKSLCVYRDNSKTEKDNTVETDITFLSHLTGLTLLDLERPKHLHHVLNPLINLKALRITTDTELLLHTLPRSLPKLEKLVLGRVTHEKSTYALTPVFNFPKLTSLCLINIPYVNHKSLQPLTSLKILVIKGNDTITDKDLCDHLTKLDTLLIEYCPLTTIQSFNTQETIQRERYYSKWV